jgi:hypothetical protein
LATCEARPSGQHKYHRPMLQWSTSVVHSKWEFL